MGGFFSVISKEDCVTELFYGTDYHSHLGTKRGGMAVHNPDGFSRAIHNIENNYFRSKFESDLPHMRGDKGIGIISDFDAQPLIINSHLGRFGITTVGRIKNINELAQKAFDQKMQFTETSGGDINPTEMVSMLITEKASFEEGIHHVQESIQGSCSMLIMTDRGIYAARDKLGRTPIILGQKNGALAATSETSALTNLGYEPVHCLGPGETVFMTAEGYEQRLKPRAKMQVCSFLWVYYGYPASSYEDINVEQVRYRCGSALAGRDRQTVDCVAGIPDSGIGHAIGYANAKKIPYMRPFVKYTPTWPRSFMPQNQTVRDLVAKMKLIPVKALIEGKRLLFCDDSIVRGTQLKDNIEILREYGAREVHMRIACPTLIFPCEFLNFSTSRSTLALAGRKVIREIGADADQYLHKFATAGSPEYTDMIDRIRQRLGLSTLAYQKLDDLVRAIGLPKEKLCTHCWDGSSYF